MLGRKIFWVSCVVVLLAGGTVAGWYFWIVAREKCDNYLAKNYIVHFEWDNGVKGLRFVDAQTGSETVPPGLAPALRREAGEKLKKIMAAVGKAEGRASFSIQGCGEPYLVQWSPEMEIPRLSELLGAAEAWDLERVRELLAEGINVDARGFAGLTPLAWAASDPSKKYPPEALQKLPRKPDSRTVEFLLHAGADPNARDDEGITVLMHADSSAAGLLLAAGADVNARDTLRETPLMHAARNGDAETIKLEMAAHADVNAADRNGWTALMYAADKGSLEAVRALLAAGADRDMKNNRGQTALAIAQEQAKHNPQFRRMVALLSRKR